MHANLAFKNVHKNVPNETPEQCRSLLQNILVKLDIHMEKSDRLNGQRHIFTKFCNDQDAEAIRFKAIKYNKNNKNKDFINVKRQFTSGVQSRCDKLNEKNF